MDLRELYAQQLGERGFQPDPVQRAVIERLDDLRNRLLAARKTEISLMRRWLGALGTGPSVEPVRGLYLWGGVWRGKTWMMDLFFQSLPFPERRRRHFHRFMHDVHTELKTLREREDPLDIVADRIAQDARVLCFDELFVSDIADAMSSGRPVRRALFKRGVTLVAVVERAAEVIFIRVGCSGKGLCPPSSCSSSISMWWPLTELLITGCGD